MKPSTLASYLESLAGLIRSCRPGESFPRVQVKAGARPSVELSGTRVAGPLPIPTADQDTVAFLVACFPALARASADDRLPVETSGVLEALRKQLSDSRESNARNLAAIADLNNQADGAASTIGRLQSERASLKATNEQLTRELEALRRTVDRMRVAPSVTVAPAVKPAPAVPPAPGGDFLSLIVEDHTGRSEVVDRPIRPQFSILPVVLAFPPNGQGKTLAAAAVALDEVRALFTFKFLDPRDASKGGYWLAKDPTAPAVHALVATLTKHGAFTRDTIPGPGHRMGGVNA